MFLNLSHSLGSPRLRSLGASGKRTPLSGWQCRRNFVESCPPAWRFSWECQNCLPNRSAWYGRADISPTKAVGDENVLQSGGRNFQRRARLAAQPAIFRCPRFDLKWSARAVENQGECPGWNRYTGPETVGPGSTARMPTDRRLIAFSGSGVPMSGWQCTRTDGTAMAIFRRPVSTSNGPL